MYFIISTYPPHAYFHVLFPIRKRKSDDAAAVQKPYKSSKTGTGSWKDGPQPTDKVRTEAGDYGNDCGTDKAGGGELLDRKARKVKLNLYDT